MISGYRDSNYHCILSEERYDGKDELICFFYKHFDKLYANTLWGKFYKRSIVCDNQILFNSGIRFSEDLIFNLMYLCFCHVITLNACSEGISLPR